MEKTEKNKQTNKQKQKQSKIQVNQLKPIASSLLGNNCGKL